MNTKEVVVAVILFLILILIPTQIWLSCATNENVLFGEDYNNADDWNKISNNLSCSICNIQVCIYFLIIVIIIKLLFLYLSFHNRGKIWIR